MVVAVEMVGGNVRYYRDVRPEIIGVVELEAADFQHVIVVFLGSHLKGVALADVAAQAYVETGLLEQIVDQGGGGSLAVGTGYADLLGAVVARSEFNLGHNVGSLGRQCLYHGRCGGDAGTLDHLVGVQYLVGGMSAFLEGDFPFAQHVGIFLLDASVVGEEYVKSFYFCEHRGSYAALGPAQYNYSCHNYLILSTAKVETAKMIPIIQKRVTMRGSGMPFFW